MPKIHQFNCRKTVSKLPDNSPGKIVRGGSDGKNG